MSFFGKKFGNVMIEFLNLRLIKKFYTNKEDIMLIIPIKEGENIERALKKFKRKFEKTGVIKELRGRKAYKKPSVKRREEKIHAVYVQQLHQAEE